MTRAFFPRLSTPTEPPGTTAMAKPVRSRAESGASATSVTPWAARIARSSLMLASTTSTPPRRSTSVGATTSNGSQPSARNTTTLLLIGTSLSRNRTSHDSYCRATELSVRSQKPTVGAAVIIDASPTAILKGRPHVATTVRHCRYEVLTLAPGPEALGPAGRRDRTNLPSRRRVRLHLRAL